jgi:hypothetical protein
LTSGIGRTRFSCFDSGSFNDGSIRHDPSYDATETYAHLAEDPLREAVQRQGANLAKVIQLKCGDGNGGAILPDKERQESA